MEASWILESELRQNGCADFCLKALVAVAKLTPLLCCVEMQLRPCQAYVLGDVNCECRYEDVISNFVFLSAHLIKVFC